MAVLLVTASPTAMPQTIFPTVFLFHSYGSISRVVYFALTSTMQPTSRKPNLTSI